MHWLSLIDAAESRQIRGTMVFHAGTGELPYCLTLQGGAKMPARGREGGGSVVAECSAVMAETGRRTARKATDLSRPLHTKTPASWGIRKEFTSNVERGLWRRIWITMANTEMRIPGKCALRVRRTETPAAPSLTVH